MTLPDELWLDPLDGDDLVIYDRAVDKQYVRYTRADAAPKVDIETVRHDTIRAMSRLTATEAGIVSRAIDHIAARYTLTPKHAEEENKG